MCRIFLYKGFLSDDECDHLVKLGKEKLQRSMVADNESGKSVMSEVHTSSGMFVLSLALWRRELQPGPFFQKRMLRTFRYSGTSMAKDTIHILIIFTTKSINYMVVTVHVSIHG